MASITRTYSAIATPGFSIGRQTLKIAKLAGVGGNNTDTTVYLGFYTTTIASASTTVLGQATAPTNNQVPVYEILVTKNLEFSDNISAGLPSIPGPIYVALSSAQGKYTATTGDTVDVFIEMEEWEEEVIGSLSSATVASGNTLDVWDNTLAVPTTAKALYDVIALDLGNSSGAQLYLQLFGCNLSSIFAGLVPLRTWQIPLASGTNNGVNINLTGALLLNFGDPSGMGYTPMQQGLGTLGVNNATQGVNTSSCALVVSTTPTVYTTASDTAAMIVARYGIPII